MPFFGELRKRNAAGAISWTDHGRPWLVCLWMAQDSLKWYFNSTSKMQAFAQSMQWLCFQACSTRAELKNSTFSIALLFMLQYFGSWVLAQFLQHSWHHSHNKGSCPLRWTCLHCMGIQSFGWERRVFSVCWMVAYGIGFQDLNLKWHELQLSQKNECILHGSFIC